MQVSDSQVQLAATAALSTVTLRCADFAGTTAYKYTASLAGALFDLARDATQFELPELHLATRIVDVDADEVPLGIVVEHDPVGDLATLDARVPGEVDI